jgi:hypothetical protein
MPLMNSPALVEKLESAWLVNCIDLSARPGAVSP